MSSFPSGRFYIVLLLNLPEISKALVSLIEAARQNKCKNKNKQQDNKRTIACIKC